MPKTRDNGFRELINRFTTDLAAAISAQVERQVSAALARVQRGAPVRPEKQGKVDGRRGGRLCPVPGCGRPGAGPRNRWFCKEHSSKLSVSEQKSILERNKRLAAEGKLPTAVPRARIVRLPPKEKRPRRSLDMTCRVEGCHNRSRGPRAGFICDLHRAQLSLEEQKAARSLYNERTRNGTAAPAQAEAKPAGSPSAVPPIVRKAEPTADA
jgi:hypothetical protein